MVPLGGKQIGGGFWRGSTKRNHWLSILVALITTVTVYYQYKLLAQATNVMHQVELQLERGKKPDADKRRLADCNSTSNVSREDAFHNASTRKNKYISYPDYDLEILNRACKMDLTDDDLTRCHNKADKGSGYAVVPHLHVLGERHSGTNLVAKIIEKNFNVQYDYLRPEDFPWVERMPIGSEFGLNRHKHNIQKDTGHYPGLSVLSMKNPYDWVHSMIQKCYFCARTNQEATSDAQNFVKMVWKGGDHEDNYVFQNLLDMRKEKICNHIKTAATRSDCLLISRSEDTILAVQQETLVWRAAEMTGWKMKQSMPQIDLGYSGMNAEGVVQDEPISVALLHRMMYGRGNFSRQEELVIEAVNSVLDVEFERSLGYHKILLQTKL
eukprot:jgi/Picsp_1/4925/NSC_02289-R1_---NA---